MGPKIGDHGGIRIMDLLLPQKKHCPRGYEDLVAMVKSKLFHKRALLRSESNTKSLKNEERKREKVT